MDIRFTYECTFIIPQLKTEKDDQKLYLVILTLLIIYSILVQLINAFFERNRLNNSHKKLESILYFFSLFNLVIIMYLLMTCNAGVIIATILSQTFGYLIFLPISYEKKNLTAFLRISDNEIDSNSLQS